MMANDKKSKPAGLSKKEFILSKPDLSAKEVVDAAAKEGLDVTTGYVYVTRSQATVKSRAAKTAGKKATRRAPRKAPAEATKTLRRTKERGQSSKALATTPLEKNHAVAFVDMVLEIGLSRAEALLRELRKVGPLVSARA